MRRYAATEMVWWDALRAGCLRAPRSAAAWCSLPEASQTSVGTTG